MTDSYIQIPPDSTGRKVKTYAIAGNEIQAIVLNDSNGNEVAPLTDTLLRASPVAVSTGLTPLTDTQLRASAVNVTLPNQTGTNYNVAGVIAVNTDLITLDCQGLASVSIQCISMGTSGVVTPYWTNDNLTLAAATLNTPAGAAATTFSAAGLWTTPVLGRYLKLRLTTATTAGTTNIQVQGMPTGSNLPSATQPVTVSSGTITTVTTVAAVTSSNLGIPGLIADVASAAITTTTTTSAITPTYGTTYIVSIPVTAVSGTTPTMDVGIEESTDGGANWFRVYDFPRITATGFYQSPPLTLRGARVRYVQTIAGTTPSFTRAINRLQRSDDAPLRAQFIDRTIVPNTASSTSTSFYIEGMVDFQAILRTTAWTTSATITLQLSHDGNNWFNHATTISLSAAGIFRQFYQNELGWKFARFFVSAAGTGITLDYASLAGVGR